MQFIGDPWSVPHPSNGINDRVNLDTRFVWYALLHVDEYPVYSRDINQVLNDYGESVHVNKIGHIMRVLCGRGYFTRVKHHVSGKGPYYKYTPTRLFLDLQQQWEDMGV